MPRLCTLVLALLLSGPARAATVLSVGDGDTLRVTEGAQRVTVRLACIDAPEMAQRPYGPAARQRLQQLAPIGSTVTLRTQTNDRYGRTVAEVFRNGQLINLAMVRDGQAFAYRQYLSDCDRSAYLGAEVAASSQRAGVWSVPGGIARPWDWRRGSRPAPTAASPASPASGASIGGQRYTCRQIGSFTRAQELLRQGHSYLDRDGDGVACESLR